MRVYVGTIADRGFDLNHFRSMLLLKHQYPGVAIMPFAGDAWIERARGIVATHFLTETDCDVLLTVDSDIDFEADDAMKVCEQALEVDGIVCGAYSGRKLGHPKPLLDLWPDTEVEFADNPELVPIKYGASGFMAAPRSVFEALMKRDDMPLCYAGKPMQFYPFYRTKIVEVDGLGPIPLSEDYAFCEHAREEGFETYVNPAVRLGHQGSHVFRLEDMVRRPIGDFAVKVIREGNEYKAGAATPNPNGRSALTTASP